MASDNQNMLDLIGMRKRTELIKERARTKEVITNDYVYDAINTTPSEYNKPKIIKSKIENESYNELRMRLIITENEKLNNDILRLNHENKILTDRIKKSNNINNNFWTELFTSIKKIIIVTYNETIKWFNT